MSFQKVTPTRTSYFRLQNRLKFAKKGKRLLEIKREQFFNEIRRLRNQAINEKKKLQQILDKGYYNLNFAYLFSGKSEIEFLAEYLKKFNIINFKVTWARKYGIEVPRFKDLDFSTAKIIPYGFLETSIYLDRAIKFFREAFAAILKIAELEGELFKLAFEFQKLKRRINSLENFTIPALENNIKVIENILEDLEREEYIQMKEIKKRLVTEEEESSLIRS